MESFINKDAFIPREYEKKIRNKTEKEIRFGRIIDDCLNILAEDDVYSIIKDLLSEGTDFISLYSVNNDRIYMLNEKFKGLNLNLVDVYDVDDCIRITDMNYEDCEIENRYCGLVLTLNVTNPSKYSLFLTKH